MKPQPLKPVATMVLAPTKGYKGATGLIGFSRNGDAVKSAVILKVEKSGFKYVTTVNP